ncbi:MAG: cytochrome c4 [Chromatiaceae bacterium]|nr:cytochrome c4 [Gammaproteobacteria bacterium]MCP5300169.1 cytochrome c4 [Chromatiaceae bacterium]MCP5422241.1 cytochrome c4 [Chromatiaceae bacterium]
MKKFLTIAAFAVCSAVGATHAAGDVEAGKAKAAMCMACHGQDGNSAAPNFPKLAGQGADYIAKQLSDFKSGARTDATMNGMAAALTDEDMANLGAFYASQTVKVGTAAEDKVEAGQALYRAGNPASGVSACTACHGPTGAGNPLAKFPSLGGQHADYVAAQLKNFRSGARANDAGSMMRAIAKKMTDTEIDAVSQYVQGLH